MGPPKEQDSIGSSNKEDDDSCSTDAEKTDKRGTLILTQHVPTIQIHNKIP